MASAQGGDSGNRNRIFFYFGALTLFVYLATPVSNLVDIQTSFLLKNRLHATPTDVSTFRLVTGIPAYIAFLFGLIRDQWNPFGRRDRGYIMLFASITAAVYLWMGFARVSYATLVAGVFIAIAAFRFVSSAYEGLMALVGQEKLMSGRLASLWWVISSLPVLAATLTSGYVSSHLNPQSAFFLAAAFALLLALIGFWKPAAVFAGAYEKPQARTVDFVSDLKRLFRHGAIYPAVLIMLISSFAPGIGTPLQFYLSDHLHAPDSIFSYFYAIFIASFVPTMALYGFLCKKVPMRKLLIWSTIIAIPQLIPLTLIHSANLALVMAVPMGLLAGLSIPAYWDLAMRSCPSGMHGTLMALVQGAYYLAGRGGDLLGAKIYSMNPANGFFYCAIATAIINVLILPLIQLVPRELIATADGEANPALTQAELA